MRERIAAQQELRFETPKRPTVDSQSGGKRKDVLRVISGSCEVFGCELFPGHEYPLLPGKSFGVFTWFGCEVELDESFCLGIYSSEETPMTQVLKIHNNLELWRSKGTVESTAQVPRVAVVGPPNCGKSSLARTLAAYAVRCGRKPVFVDVDVGKNSIAIPGTVAATVLRNRSDLFEEEGELGLCARQPLAYFVGVEKVTDNTKRVKEQAKLLSDAIDVKLNSDPEVKSSGIIVDTFAWSANQSVSQTLIGSLKNLGINVVVVIEHDRLLAEMKKELKDAVVVKIGRSGGVAEAEANSTIRCASARFQWYFEGSRRQLTPVVRAVTVGKDVKIVLAKANVVFDDSIRPIGMSKSSDEDDVPKLTVLDSSLKNAVFAVVYASNEKEALQSNAAGFVYVNDLDAKENILTLCTPCPGDLKSTFLVHGRVKLSETV